jgi:7TM diverse intracellular signalling
LSKFIVAFLLLFLPFFGLTQPVFTLNNADNVEINNYSLLADKGYSFEKILSDKTLQFIDGESIKSNISKVYWIKLKVYNPFAYDQSYLIWARPILDNTLYYYDETTKRWASKNTNIKLASPTNPHNKAVVDFVFKANATTTLYYKSNISLVGEKQYNFKPIIFLRKADFAQKQDQIIAVVWAASLIVLFLFFLNNIYVFFSFHDKAVLNYLIAQLGGMIYITAYSDFFNSFFPNHLFTFLMQPIGSVNEYDVNFLMMHISLLLITYGLVHFTRIYLATSKTLPKLDLWLRYGLIVYSAITLVVIIINVGIAYVEDNIIVFENILFLLLLLIILITSIIGYLKSLPNSVPFLIAYLLPLLFMLAASSFHIVFYNGDTNNFMPHLAIIAQSLGFSIALVARTKFIQNALSAKEIETTQLGFELREVGLKHQLAAMENEKITNEILFEKTNNELLSEKLAANQRELASSTLYMVQKNELLAQLKSQIDQLHKANPNNKQQGLKGIESILQSNLYLDADWRKFKVHFEQVHPNFFENLELKFPNLTKYETRLYSYFHIKLSTKEIAALLNIDPASVRRAKTRLLKKMHIVDTDNGLVD